MKRELLCLAFAVLPAAIFSSCAGIGFDSAWQDAVADYEAGNRDPVSGPWTGSWHSDDNGHSGDLRCLVTPSEAVDGRYKFRYHATWGGMKGGFATEYDVVRSDSGFKVEGDHNLGIFGKYAHKGRIRKNRFDAQFSAPKGDYGTFEMNRP